MKIALAAEPTFDASVPIHVPGKKEPVMVRFTFKHMALDEFEKFSKEAKAKNMKNIDYIMRICAGWELDEEFTRKNMEIFLNQRHTSAAAIIQTYYQELFGITPEGIGARAKN
jgi:hypothetical protein